MSLAQGSLAVTLAAAGKDDPADISRLGRVKWRKWWHGFQIHSEQKEKVRLFGFV
jgi:hypothetical protein